MTPLPDYDPSKFALLKPGRYMFRITDPPTKRRFGKAVGIILKFLSFSEEDGSAKESTCLIWPWTDEYRILKEEIIQSADEDAWVGRSFMAEVEIGKHPTKLGQKIQNIINIEPFYPEETEKEPEPELEPEPEVEDTTVTPPPPEEGDPGPEEKDAPPEEEETDTTPPLSKEEEEELIEKKFPKEKEDKQEPTKEDKPGPKDEEAANKKDFPKDAKEKDGPPW